MVNDLEEENLNNPESAEDVGEIKELPEKLIESPEQLSKLAEETTDQIDESSADFKREGKEKIDSAAESYEATPGDVVAVKFNLGEIHNDVDELADSSKAEVDNINKGELRDYTKQEKADQRQELARQIEKERIKFFEAKREIQAKMEKIKLDIENKTKNLDILKKDLQATKDAINENRSSLFSRIIERSKIRELHELGEEAEPKIEDLEGELQELLSNQAELTDHLQQQLDIKKLQQDVQDFYDDNIDDFKADQETKRIEEQERLEKEEEMRKIENIVEEQGVVFVHGIMDDFVPTSNSLLTKGVDFETKLKLALSLDPTISTSTIKKGDGPRNMWAQMGLILGKGRVDGAASSDAASAAEGIKKRTLGFGDQSIEKINKSINNTGDRYNEFKYT